MPKTVCKDFMTQDFLTKQNYFRCLLQARGCHELRDSFKNLKKGESGETQEIASSTLHASV